MSRYRSHFCAELNKSNIGEVVKVAGWVRKKRDHGPIIFIDLIDQTASKSSVLQCIAEKNSKTFEILEKITLESVISLEGKVVQRQKDTINKEISTGEIELKIESVEILSQADTLPFAIHQEDIPEEFKFKYRFLYLRRKEIQKILELRTRAIDFLRAEMKKRDFLEVQTPILTASSPEGARDYLVPSRIHKGKFYALPQAPQQFKQILMASGVEKYFQIAPCFRDEDSRSDRLPGEFYQLDFEVSFATQDDILNILESLISGLFKHIRPDVKSDQKFEKIKYKDAIEKYGSDKPDLRNPLVLNDITKIVETPNMFKKLVEDGGKLIAISVPQCKGKSRKFFDELQEIAKEHGAKGLAYMAKNNEDSLSGPLVNMFPEKDRKNILNDQHDAAFLLADMPENAYKIGGILRQLLGQKLGLISNEYKFCFIVDFPMFEWNGDEKRWDFMHNPFSKPQEMKKDPGEILAWQYDLVCNGYEICSGAVRNYQKEMVEQVFKIAGYEWRDIENNFAVFKAFKYGVPPHAGAAPGIDRIIMLLSDAKNVRDVVAFPLNQNAEDIMMGAPSRIDEKSLEKDLGLKLKLKLD